MKLFDVDNNWAQIQEHLDTPIVQLALDLGMSVYAENNPDAPGAWNVIRVPWMFSSTYWDKIARQRFAASPYQETWERMYNEKKSKVNDLEAWYNSDEYKQIWDYYAEYLAIYYPQPNTPDWYRCYGAEQFLGAFNCALGIKVAPYLQWSVVSGAKHTTAIGYENDEPVLCFDILAKTDENPEYILGNIRPILFKAFLGRDLVNLHRCLGKGAI